MQPRLTYWPYVYSAQGSSQNLNNCGILGKPRINWILLSISEVLWNHDAASLQIFLRLTYYQAILQLSRSCHLWNYLILLDWEVNTTRIRKSLIYQVQRDHGLVSKK